MQPKLRKMKNPFRKKEEVRLLSQKQINRRNFISFAGFLGLNALAYSAWKWLYHSPKELRAVTGGTHEPLRQALNKTETVFRKNFSPNHLIKTYPKTMAAKKVRVNRRIGMIDNGFNSEAWKLKVIKKDGSLLLVDLDEIKALPKTEMIFDFKCVEGWDQIQYWAGVKFIDFIEH